jgi:5-aminopentanamidase
LDKLEKINAETTCLKLALYQGPSPQGDTSEAMRRIDDMLSAAALAGARMMVFPELFLPGYNQMQSPAFATQRTGEAWETAFSELTKKHGCGLCIGWAELTQNGIYNAASCFDHAGQKRAHYRKQHLYGPIEKSVFNAGQGDCVFELDGVKTAILICYDVEFAHRVRALREHDVDLILVPTANPIAFGKVSDVLVPARANENRVTIAYANYCDAENGLTYGGRSVIVGPDGDVLAAAGRGEALLIVNLNAVDRIDTSMLSTQREDLRA